MSELERFVPQAVKEASTQAHTVAGKAPEIARLVVDEVQRAGVVGTVTGPAKTMARFELAAKQVYARYGPVAQHYAVATWRALNGLPLVHLVAQVADDWTQKYSGALCYDEEKGYAVAAYLLLVSVEMIS